MFLRSQSRGRAVYRQNEFDEVNFNIVETRHGVSLQRVTPKICDVLGREIPTLVNEYKSPGKYEVEFDGRRLPNGVYFYQLRAGDYVSTKKSVLLK
ncbi:MAG: T9SS type A sorting domain-containing protein [bacterium]